MTTIGYPYTLPTTANVSFQEYFAPNANAQYQRPLSDATAFRGRLRTALKEHKHSDRHDFLNIQKVCNTPAHVVGICVQGSLVLHSLHHFTAC